MNIRKPDRPKSPSFPFSFELTYEVSEFFDHSVLIVFRQVGIEGYAQATLEKAFRSGKSDFTNHSFEIRVPVKRHIVNLRQDVSLLEELVSQVSSAFCLANDEQMPSITRISTGSSKWSQNSFSAVTHIVGFRDLLGEKIIKPFRLRYSKGGLHVGQPVVPPEIFLFVSPEVSWFSSKGRIMP